METFGEYIRQLRINAGLPLRKVAEQKVEYLKSKAK